MKQFIRDVLMYDGFSPLECCNVELQYHAIAEVSTALDNHELVRPFQTAGGLKA